MKGAIRHPRSTPRKTVEFQFDQLKRIVRNLLVDNRNFKAGEDGGRRTIPHAFRDHAAATPREIPASAFAGGQLKEMAEHIIESLDGARELCADMAADAEPGKSGLFLFGAPEHDQERLVRASDAETARAHFIAVLRDEVGITGSVRIIGHQLPPEDAVSEGVLDWEPFSLGAVDVEIEESEVWLQRAQAGF